MSAMTNGSEEDVRAEMGFLPLEIMLDQYRKSSCAPSIQTDLKTVFAWLGQDIGELTAQSEVLYRRGYLAYLSIGVAPSFQLQKSFDMAFAHPEARARAKHKPPEAVMDAFDRMFASDSEIASKRKHDWEVETAQMSQALNKVRVSHSGTGWLVNFVIGTTEKARLFRAVSVAWCVWVLLRTEIYFELVGFQFHQWDEEMLVANLLALPVLVYLSHYLFKVYAKMRK
ncbi:hypothetical protein [Massilia glaciei]|nr:hypothetical protein [Massilia glaciei]